LAADAIGEESARNSAVNATASRESGSLIYTDENTKASARHQTLTMKIAAIGVNFTFHRGDPRSLGE
jgi:hypothetical protein